MVSGNDLIFKNALEQFADPQYGILDASLNLLKLIVGVDKFTLGSRKPRIFKDLCARREVTYQQILNEVVDNIKSTYYVARLDERAFSNPTDAVELDKALEDASQEKYKGILIFAIDVDENTKLNRTLAAELTRVFNKLSNNPVILFIRQGVSLSISTCERKAKKRDVGEKMGKVNLLQGINCSKPATGHLRILGNLQINSKIRTFDALYEHWFEVFNTKTLTDKFYKELYSWYMWVVNDPNTHFPDNAQLPEHENEKKNVKIIRLITRLLFVWFIKAKKVKKEGQPEMGLVPEKLFETDELKAILNDFDPNSATDGEFYNAILQNLFFATLNNEVNSRRFVDTSNPYRSKKGYTVKNLYRDNKDKSGSWFKISHDEVLDLFKTVPFLNCGLFECLDKYKRTDINYDVDRIFDGFSTKSGDKFRACLPNRLFFADELPEITIQVTEKGKKVPLKIKSKGLINLLNEYVFTVEENTPLDQQVSLDPELLGKVFENLLAAYNPETEESARKSSGSYYTPREIVEYMVNESLIQYLKTNLNADEATEKQLRNLVNPSNPDFKLSFNQQDAILEALYHCRILDPACGSGAFPMGMLQQMVHIISRLDVNNEKWQKLITKKATEETAKAYENKELDDEERKKIIADIESSFTNSKNNPDYTRKLYLIQNCIFGVDIQPIAMMISKLRFFISLICEQDENAIDFDKKERNFGIHTLPNLETKFVAANSLLTPDVKKFTGDWTNDEHLDKLKDELMELRYRHVTARSLKDKMEIRTLDDEKRQEINDYILSTQAHADPVKIAMFEDQIAHLMLERRLYEGENIVEEYVDVQGDLFADSERKLVRKDANRAKRDEIDRQIHICQAQIDHEKAKENITGFEAAVKQLTEWNPYDQVKSSPFFDPDWMFGITDGFDIVIGNPPYLESRNPLFADIFKDALQKEISNNRASDKGFFPRGSDLLIFFYELSLRLLNKNGFNVFITENAWLSTDYGKLFQNFLLKNCVVHAIVDSEYKYFETADINTVITFFKNKNLNIDEPSIVKFFHCYSSLEKYPCNTSANVNTEGFSIKQFRSDDNLLCRHKWGVIAKADLKLLNIIDSLSQFVDKKLDERISIGQGLNLTKNLITKDKTETTFPIYVSDLGPNYTWEKPSCYVHKKDISKTRMIPSLILPRGIGTHFCCVNNCKGYSASYVEVYGKMTQEELLNIWLFCNSSLFWLLREITGRTNLGGGMLKAEATDLKSIPICFNFNRSIDIKKIYSSLKGKALSTDLEITLNEPIHKEIDRIVLSHFNKVDENDYIISQLKEYYYGRMNKSKTK